MSGKQNTPIQDQNNFPTSARPVFLRYIVIAVGIALLAFFAHTCGKEGDEASPDDQASSGPSDGGSQHGMFDE